MRRFLLAATLLLSGCAYSPELTLLLGQKRIEGDVEVGVTATVLQRFGERGHGVCGLAHASDPQHGKPFNDDEEITFDLKGCGGRWGGNPR